MNRRTNSSKKARDERRKMVDLEQAAEEELATMDVHEEGSIETTDNLLNPDL